jgi:Mn-dependent DtxR family transcriptional regulator
MGRKRFHCVKCRKTQRVSEITYAVVDLGYLHHILDIGESHGFTTIRQVSAAIGMNPQYLENIMYKLYKRQITHVRKETAIKMEKWERALDIGKRHGTIELGYDDVGRLRRDVAIRDRTAK